MFRHAGNEHRAPGLDRDLAAVEAHQAGAGDDIIHFRRRMPVQAKPISRPKLGDPAGHPLRLGRSFGDEGAPAKPPAHRIVPAVLRRILFVERERLDLIRWFHLPPPQFIARPMFVGPGPRLSDRPARTNGTPRPDTAAGAADSLSHIGLAGLDVAAAQRGRRFTTKDTKDHQDFVTLRVLRGELTIPPQAAGLSHRRDRERHASNRNCAGASSLRLSRRLAGMMNGSAFPSRDALTIGFAHVAYRGAEEFAARRTGVAHFEARTFEELKRRAHEADVLVVSGLWRNTLLAAM